MQSGIKVVSLERPYTSKSGPGNAVLLKRFYNQFNLALFACQNPGQVRLALALPFRLIKPRDLNFH